jgi:hypothetical protein
MCLTVRLLLSGGANSIASEKCDETLSIYDGQSTDHSTSSPFICVVTDKLPHSDIGTSSADAHRIQFGFNSTGNRVQIVYRKPVGQLSNLDPTWIYFRFWRTRLVAGTRREIVAKESHAEQTISSHNTGSQSTTFDYTTTSSSSHSVMSLLLLAHSSSSCCTVRLEISLFALFVASLTFFIEER